MAVYIRARKRALAALTAIDGHKEEYKSKHLGPMRLGVHFVVVLSMHQAAIY